MSAGGKRLTQEAVLAGLLAAEIAVFSLIGTNFLSRDNAFEVVRLIVEIGLLALALTPVIVTGGIDLSVGSLMGLSAVLFGMMWRDLGLPIGIAAVATLGVGALGGGLNALLIGGLRLPPLIVTLGTLSLYRGLAEGLTGGTDNFTNFPESFLFVGQRYLPGGVPAQLPIFVVATLGFWFLLQRTTLGRAFYAIGMAPEGARHAGIPVERRLTLVYILSGTVASLAALVYVAHLGQAKADAGTGYELLAITAVVLGGTSIFGGRGTIQGTVLGLFAIAVLQNGLRLAALPSELAGILTGAVLLVTITLERLSAKPAEPIRPSSEEFEVRNSQVAVLSGVILLAALIVAGSNWLLMRNYQPDRTRTARQERITVAMMPKSKGNAYFIACRKGAEQAAQELGVDLIWDGPSDPDPAKQNEVIEAWITRGVDVIAVSVENSIGISPVLRKARERGIKVVTWDSDADPDARDFFVNQATPQGIGQTLTDQAARIMKGKGEFAIIKASVTAANMIAWENEIKARLKEKYPDMKLAVVRPCDDKPTIAFEEANNILGAYKDVKLIMAICSPAVPGAAEAVKQAGRKDVKVIGLGLPSENKGYVHEGITDCIVLWKTEDLGYLTVYASQALKKGTLRPGQKSVSAGRLGNIEIQGTDILLGTPFVFTKENIDQFDF
jgi:ribose/xylose/arabinose/galactoside ABC-type transport system permease subunit/ABC-type sugar transport system substrate-binding protein